MSLQCFFSVVATNFFKFQIRLHKSYVKHISALRLNVVQRITGPGKLLLFAFKIKVSVDL